MRLGKVTDHTGTERQSSMTYNHGTGRGLMNITEVAEHLGVQVRHVRRLVHERRIPFVKWGHLLRFDPADVEAWIDEARVAADDGRSW